MKMVCSARGTGVCILEKWLLGMRTGWGSWGHVTRVAAIVFLCWVQGSGERSSRSKNVLSSKTTTGTGIHWAKPVLPGYVFNVLCSLFYFICSITLGCTITMLLFSRRGETEPWRAWLAQGHAAIKWWGWDLHEPRQSDSRGYTTLW